MNDPIGFFLKFVLKSFWFWEIFFPCELNVPPDNAYLMVVDYHESHAYIHKTCTNFFDR